MPRSAFGSQQLIELLGRLFAQNVIGVSSHNLGKGYDFYQCPACGNVRNASRKAREMAFGPENITYIRHKENCALFRLYEMVECSKGTAEKGKTSMAGPANRRR